MRSGPRGRILTKGGRGGSDDVVQARTSVMVLAVVAIVTVAMETVAMDIVAMETVTMVALHAAALTALTATLAATLPVASPDAAAIGAVTKYAIVSC